jgi:hypothetical protein
MPDGTKFAVSSTNVAQYQHRRGSSAPAIAPIGTIRVRANGLQPVSFECLVCMLKHLARAESPFEPCRQPSFLCEICEIRHFFEFLVLSF